MTATKTLQIAMTLCVAWAATGCGAAPDFLQESLLSAVQGSIESTIEQTVQDAIGQTLEGGFLPDIGLP